MKIFFVGNENSSPSVLRLISQTPSGCLSKIKEKISADLHVLQKLQRILRKGKWKVTVAIRDKNRIIEIWPGLKETIYGIALDIGSTTISAHLVDLHSGITIASSGTMNPQIKFGEDLTPNVYMLRMILSDEVLIAKFVKK